MGQIMPWRENDRKTVSDRVGYGVSEILPKGEGDEPVGSNISILQFVSRQRTDHVNSLHAGGRNRRLDLRGRYVAVHAYHCKVAIVGSSRAESCDRLDRPLHRVQPTNAEEQAFGITDAKPVAKPLSANIPILDLPYLDRPMDHYPAIRRNPWLGFFGLPAGGEDDSLGPGEIRSSVRRQPGPLEPSPLG